MGSPLSDVVVSRRSSGEIVLRSRAELEAYPRNVAAPLRKWAIEPPDQVFLAARRGDGQWRRVTYRQSFDTVRALAQTLLSFRVDRSRPIMMLSGASIEFAFLSLAANYIGMATVPISPSFTVGPNISARLKAAIDLTKPAVAFAQTRSRREAVFEFLAQTVGAKAIVVDGEPTYDVYRFSDLEQPRSTEEADQMHSAVGPETIARILFTSGSSGSPKAVPTTHGMICANQQSIAQCWRFLENRPPVIADWLPWHHGFGANHNFHLVLRSGGALYIDNGRPTASDIGETLRSNCEVSPTMHFNIPLGYEMIASYLESRETAAVSFFKRLDALFYAGAPLSTRIKLRIDQLARRSIGRTVPMLTAWGATETTSSATIAYGTLDEIGGVGLPAPGLDVKLSPVEGGHELRVRGPAAVRTRLELSLLRRQKLKVLQRPSSRCAAQSSSITRGIPPDRPASGEQ
jgi:feruloyl-CoA synthase